MLYNIYEQKTPTVVAKTKPFQPKMFEAELVLVQVVHVGINECPFELGRDLGIKWPVVEAVNGYDYETGRVLKGERS